MDILTHEQLVERIDEFLKRTDMAVTRLGRETNGDPNLIANIRAGRSPSLETLNKLARVMATHEAKLAEAADATPDPVSSAPNVAENISPPAGLEAGHGHPFTAGGSAPPSSATSSPTGARPASSPASPACSTAGDEAVAA